MIGTICFSPCMIAFSSVIVPEAHTFFWQVASTGWPMFGSKFLLDFQTGFWVVSNIYLSRISNMKDMVEKQYDE